LAVFLVVVGFAAALSRIAKPRIADFALAINSDEEAQEAGHKQIAPESNLWTLGQWLEVALVIAAVHVVIVDVVRRVGAVQIKL
jgi:hypothetical protein